MALTWSFESLETPIFSATLCTLRVLVPVAYISATAATRARSTRRLRSSKSSGEEAAGAQLGDAQRQRADAGGERPLAVAVSAFRPATAQLVGLGVHHGVHDLLGESAKQLLHVDGAVVETGHGEHVRRRV